MRTVTEIFAAISQLWPLALIILIAIVIVLFRVQIRDLLDRTDKVHIKRGDNELRIEQALRRDSDSRTQEPGHEVQMLQEPATTAQAIEEVQTQPIELDAETKLLQAIFLRDFQRAEEVYQALIESVQSPEEKTRHRANYLRYLFVGGQRPEAIQELEDLLAERPQQAYFILVQEAHCHFAINELEKAEATYRRALEAAISQIEKARAILQVTKCMSNLGRFEDGIDLVTQQIGAFSQDEAISTLFEAIGLLEKGKGNSEMYGIALEKSIELRPGVTGQIFSAAYALSEGKSLFSPLSLLNYETLIHVEPDNSTALNNLGVTLKQFELPIGAIHYYSLACSAGNSLAMANIANQYLHNGFVEDAERILEKARRGENPHPNVGRVSARLEDERSKQEEKLASIRQVAIRQRLFLRDYANAYYLPAIQERSIAGTWRVVEGTWEFGLADILFESSEDRVSAAQLIASPADSYKLELRGLRNRAFDVSISKSGTFALFSGTRQGLAFLEDDSSLNVMFEATENKPFGGQEDFLHFILLKRRS